MNFEKLYNETQLEKENKFLSWGENKVSISLKESVIYESSQGDLVPQEKMSEVYRTFESYVGNNEWETFRETIIDLENLEKKIFHKGFEYTLQEDKNHILENYAKSYTFEPNLHLVESYDSINQWNNDLRRKELDKERLSGGFIKTFKNEYLNEEIKNIIKQFHLFEATSFTREQIEEEIVNIFNNQNGYTTKGSNIHYDFSYNNGIEVSINKGSPIPLSDPSLNRQRGGIVSILNTKKQEAENNLNAKLNPSPPTPAPTNSPQPGPQPSLPPDFNKLVVNELNKLHKAGKLSVNFDQTLEIIEGANDTIEIKDSSNGNIGEYTQVLAAHPRELALFQQDIDKIKNDILKNLPPAPTNSPQPDENQKIVDYLNINNTTIGKNKVDFVLDNNEIKFRFSNKKNYKSLQKIDTLYPNDPIKAQKLKDILTKYIEDARIAVTGQNPGQNQPPADQEEEESTKNQPSKIDNIAINNIKRGDSEFDSLTIEERRGLTVDVLEKKIIEEFNNNERELVQDNNTDADQVIKNRLKAEKDLAKKASKRLFDIEAKKLRLEVLASFADKANPEELQEMENLKKETSGFAQLKAKIFNFIKRKAPFLGKLISFVGAAFGIATKFTVIASVFAPLGPILGTLIAILVSTALFFIQKKLFNVAGKVTDKIVEHIFKKFLAEKASGKGPLAFICRKLTAGGRAEAVTKLIVRILSTMLLAKPTASALTALVTKMSSPMIAGLTSIGVTAEAAKEIVPEGIGGKLGKIAEWAEGKTTTAPIDPDQVSETLTEPEAIKQLSGGPTELEQWNQKFATELAGKRDISVQEILRTNPNQAEQLKPLLGRHDIIVKAYDINGDEWTFVRQLNGNYKSFEEIGASVPGPGKVFSAAETVQKLTTGKAPNITETPEVFTPETPPVSPNTVVEPLPLPSEAPVGPSETIVKTPQEANQVARELQQFVRDGKLPQGHNSQEAIATAIRNSDDFKRVGNQLADYMNTHQNPVNRSNFIKELVSGGYYTERQAAAEAMRRFPEVTADTLTAQQIMSYAQQYNPGLLDTMKDKAHQLVTFNAWAAQNSKLFDTATEAATEMGIKNAVPLLDNNGTPIMSYTGSPYWINPAKGVIFDPATKMEIGPDAIHGIKPNVLKNYVRKAISLFNKSQPANNVNAALGL